MGETADVVAGLVLFGKKEKELRGVKGAGLDGRFEEIPGGKTFDKLLVDSDRDVSDTEGFGVVRAAVWESELIVSPGKVVTELTGGNCGELPAFVAAFCVALDEGNCKPCDVEVEVIDAVVSKLLEGLDGKYAVFLDDGNVLDSVLMIPPVFEPDGVDLRLLEVGLFAGPIVLDVWPPIWTSEYNSRLFAPPHASPRRSRHG